VHAKPGTRVDRGQLLARLWVRDRAQSEAIAERVRAAFVIAEEHPGARPLVLDRVDTNSTSGQSSD
jgi:thymidine phosphorylase